MKRLFGVALLVCCFSFSVMAETPATLPDWQDPQVFQDRGVGNIHQIHLQFVIGGGIILAVDLGIAGQATLDLQPISKFREGFHIFLHIFHTLGSGTNDAHITFQNIEYLR